MPSDNLRKRKRNVVIHQTSKPSAHYDTNLNTAKPTAIFKPTKGRAYTLSIALPGSIVANAQTHDAKTALCGTIARACAVFCVDEIVIFNDGQRHQSHPRWQRNSAGSGFRSFNDEEDGYTGFADPANFMYHVLSFLETPPHLRKALFPLHPNLRSAGALPSLDMPHHLRADEWCRWREGVTVGPAERAERASPMKKQKAKRKGKDAQEPTTTAMVDAGLPALVQIDTEIPPNTRVTLEFDSEDPPSSMEMLTATAVSPVEPREQGGYYWGYTTRMCDAISSVFTECPFDGGYDLSIGMSERGVPLSSLLPPNGRNLEDGRPPGLLPMFNHLLVVYGGVGGLEVAVEHDTELREKGLEGRNAGELFDYWVNLVPGQGSRTIRTEEAVWLGLMSLRDYVLTSGK